MATKYDNALAVLLNDGSSYQILPVSKSNLIELASGTKPLFNGAKDVDTALTYLMNSYMPAFDNKIQQDITYAINQLDYNNLNIEEGKAVVNVTEEDGVIEVTQGNIYSSYVLYSDSDNTTVQSYLDSLTAEDARIFSAYEAGYTALDARIDDLENYKRQYKLVPVETSTLPENVRERKQLQESNDGKTWTNVESSYVDVYKDSALLAAYLGTTGSTWDGSYVVPGTGEDALVLVYEDKNGNAQVVTIDVGDFLRENEAGKGLISQNHKIDIVKDANSEEFLKVYDDSISIEGVQDAIDDTITDRIAELNSSVGKEYQSTETAYVITGVVEAGGYLTAYQGISLTDANVKTTMSYGDALYGLAGGTKETTPTDDISNLKKALNVLASNIKAAQGDGITNIIGDQNNTYVNITGEKNDNTYTLTLDDSNLGNVALLHYDELSVAGLEAFGIYNVTNVTPEP